VTETTTSAVTTTVPTTTTAPPTTVNPDPDPKANLARATSLANTGQTLLAQGRLGQAEARFREAQAVTETKVATAGLQEVARRRREYQRLWQTGERNVRDKDYAAARTSYSAAKDLDSESFVTDGGAGRLSEIEKQITAAETVKTKMAEEAKLAEAARGESRRLVNAGRELAKQGRYDDAEASYADALKHDKDNADAARALNNSLQYRQAKATGESNAQSNDPQTLRDRAQALENARKIDGARFASDSLGKILDDINRRLAPPAVTPGPPKPVDEKPAIQARLEAFARAISTDGNPGKDNGVARTIWPTASPYFNRETQYQHFEFTNLEFLATPAGSGRQVVLCTQIQRYGPDATRLRTPISERVEIVFEKKSGTWFIVTLRTLK
jgi:tetratricopeptide (TPR) repeat protein